ncbi:type II secretion protein M [Brenneria alni]|uniref:Type II secretion system protein M n=1 Tax=Brenneria alni TaxID=71656 RepID=A0A421DK16_9GAMM|nr:type II secretion system protein M [Brenneria alni]RLM19424.1 type II secretion protein M [Brenneria alni]
MNALCRCWRSITLRERNLIMISAALLLFYLAYSLFWQPWIQRENQWQRTVLRERQTVDWMLKQAPLVAQMPPSAVSGRDLSLPLVVSQSAGQRGLAVIRLQPQGNQIAVTLGRSDFNMLIHWLAELEQQYGVRVLALDVSAVAQAPGSVDISKLLLQRADNA